MALVLTEEQGMLRDSASVFLAENAPVSSLRKLRDSRDANGFSRELWEEFANMGFTGILVPEAHGGLGLGLVEAGVVMEEIGRNLTASPFLASGVVAVTALRHAGTEAQAQQWLPALASGKSIATLAVDEQTKHNPQHIALMATRRAGGVDGYTLNGSKTFVVDGHVADVLIVAARTSGAATDAAGITLFLVDAKTPGVEIERIVMVDAHNSARVVFKDAVVPQTAVLGPVDGGRAALQAALNAGRAVAAAELVGLADEAFTRTVAYLKERKQFGQIIGEFQGLQHRAAMLYCDLELARAATIKALQSLDEIANASGATEAKGSSADLSVAIAKARAGTTATLAVQEGVQMHGGMGMTDEFEMGFFMKRARVLQELFGDASYHQNQLATLRQY